MAESYELIAGRPTYTKDPGAVLDYTLDLTPWVQPGEVLQSITLTSYGVTVDSSGIVLNTSVTFWLSGGRAGSLGRVAIKFLTSLGRIDERTLYFKIRNR